MSKNCCPKDVITKSDVRSFAWACFNTLFILGMAGVVLGLICSASAQYARNNLAHELQAEIKKCPGQRAGAVFSDGTVFCY